MVNTDIVLNEHVDTIQTSKAEAETMGAVAFFGDKYGDRVRVVRAGRHSLEFCGGTHVERLGDIGQIQVVSESSIGANTRRLEAVSGLGAHRRSYEMEQSLNAVAAILKTSLDDVVPALERLFERQRDVEKEVASLAPGAAHPVRQRARRRERRRRGRRARRRVRRRAAAHPGPRPPASRSPRGRAGRRERRQSVLGRRD